MKYRMRSAVLTVTATSLAVVAQPVRASSSSVIDVTRTLTYLRNSLWIPFGLGSVQTVLVAVADDLRHSPPRLI